MGAALLVAAVAAQALPVRPVSPWTGQVQVLVCDTVSSDRVAAEYVVTLTDTHAFIAGQEPGQALKMDEFVQFKAMPPVQRGQVVVRRLSFAIGSQTAFVRQLYQSDELVSTFVSVGNDATADIDLPFENTAGFCLPAQSLNAEATQ